MEGTDLVADLDTFLAEHEAELIEFRRDLHAHPELAYNEHRTTRRVALRLRQKAQEPVESRLRQHLLRRGDLQLPSALYLTAQTEFSFCLLRYVTVETPPH